MSVAYLQRPVYFMGAKTVFLAQSARHASIIIHMWLAGAGPYDWSKYPLIPKPPTVPREYCPALRLSPTLGRLYKNTRLNADQTAWIVGLGLPDRRRTFVT